ncbi:MAG TPA: polysaccharide export protein [Gammaproteobacteria bacterium]|nr:polysaccharide export protein [Gammaproteobacteria bacterium]
MVLLYMIPVAGITAEDGAADNLPLSDTPAYRIGPEDVLEIFVWKEPELQREVLVRPDGGISFPLAGDLEAAGRTPVEVQEELTKRLQRYIPEAVVTVTVTKVAGYRIFVVGKVTNPGQFVVGRYVNVLQALTLAGGLTPYASENKIKVVRKKDGKEITFPFQYSEVKKGRKLEQNILLQSGDVVVVP